MRALSKTDREFKAIALAEYYSRPWQVEVEAIVPVCLDSPSAPAACFDLWRYVQRPEAERQLRFWAASRAKAPAECIALVRLRLVTRRLDLGRREAEMCLAEAIKSGDPEFVLYAKVQLAEATGSEGGVSLGARLYEEIAVLAEETGEYDLAFQSRLAGASRCRDLGRADEADQMIKRLWEETQANLNDFHIVEMAADDMLQACRNGLPEEAQDWEERVVLAYRRIGMEEPADYWLRVASSYEKKGDLITARRLITGATRSNPRRTEGKPQEPFCPSWSLEHRLRAGGLV